MPDATIPTEDFVLIGADGQPIKLAGPNWFDNTVAFFQEVGSTVIDKLKSFALGVWQNMEGIAILSAASIGFTYLIGELPFIFMLPAIIEGAMVAPVLAVIIVVGLLYIAKKRQDFRKREAEPAIAMPAAA